jgi:hypothetical protein
MITATIFNLLLGAGIFFVTYSGCFLLLRSGKQNQTREIQKKPIEELTEIWMKKKVECGQVHIAELTPLWKAEENDQQQAIPQCEFTNERIQAFYKTHIESMRNAELQKAVCRNLLVLLDKEGGCPSVVNVKGDFESSLNSNVFSLLGKTNLLDHTLNVADQIIEMLDGTDNKHMTPDALVTAIAHDLGKFPSRKGHLYSMGEHPLAAGNILVEIAEFERLARKDEIYQAVMLHHKKPDSFLGRLLKRADQIARQQEYDKQLRELPPATQAEIEAIMQSQKTEKGKKGIEIFNEEDEPDENTEVPQIIDISRWFKLQAFLNDMKPYINKLEDGRRFLAFSMPNGYVYFMPKVLEEIARKQTNAAGVLDMAFGDDDETRRNILLSIAGQLRKAEVFAADLLGKDYFGASFNITRIGTGKSLQGYYMPCHAEAFGSIAEMEALKTGILTGFKSVEQYHRAEHG